MEPQEDEESFFPGQGDDQSMAQLPQEPDAIVTTPEEIMQIQDPAQLDLNMRHWQAILGQAQQMLQICQQAGQRLEQGNPQSGYYQG